MAAEEKEVTFRDFAAAVMTGDAARGAAVLEVLLALDKGAATAAAGHFTQQMGAGGQPFMMKAMGLRTAVTSGTDAQIQGLLGECFGLSDEVAENSTRALRDRYRSPE